MAHTCLPAGVASTKYLETKALDLKLSYYTFFWVETEEPSSFLFKSDPTYF
jgi:hypothetical protein